MDVPVYGMPNLRMAWGPWLRGEAVKRTLAMMLGQMAPKPHCPKCGTETTDDTVLKTLNCHVCQKTWTKMEFLIEVIDRRRKAAWQSYLDYDPEKDQPIATDS